MTPGEARAEIDSLERELASLEPWIEQLVEARGETFEPNDPEARDVLERGVSGGNGRPAGAVFEALENGKPGLIKAQARIAFLRDRRRALARLLPSAEQEEATLAEVARRVKQLHALGTGLRARIEQFRKALDLAAAYGLDVAERVNQLSVANAALTAMCTDADVFRPQTPHAASLNLPLANPMIALLAGSFTGAKVMSPDAQVVAAIRRLTEVAPVEAVTNDADDDADDAVRGNGRGVFRTV